VSKSGSSEHAVAEHDRSGTGDGRQEGVASTESSRSGSAVISHGGQSVRNGGSGGRHDASATFIGIIAGRLDGSLRRFRHHSVM
jgi:hypothetical protein